MSQGSFRGLRRKVYRGGVIEGRSGSEAREDVLVGLLTEARLSSYARATRTRSGALRLYQWNGCAAAGVMELVGAVEVIGRNALDRELTSWADRRNAGDWIDEAPLDPRGKQDVAKAAERAARADPVTDTTASWPS